MVTDQDVAAVQAGFDAGMAASDARQVMAHGVLDGYVPVDGGDVTAGGRE